MQLQKLFTSEHPQELRKLIGQLWPQREVRMTYNLLSLPASQLACLFIPPKLSNQCPQHLGLLRSKQLLELHQTLFPSPNIWGERRRVTRVYCKDLDPFLAPKFDESRLLSANGRSSTNCLCDTMQYLCCLIDFFILFFVKGRMVPDYRDFIVTIPKRYTREGQSHIIIHLGSQKC